MTYKETLEKAKQNGIGALELKIADMVDIYLTDIDEKLSDEEFESLCDIVNDKLQSMGGEIPYTLYDVVEEAFEENAATEQAKKAAAPKAEKEKTKKKRMSYFEKQEWETIEDEIAKLEEDIETIETQMQENASDYGKLAELQRSLDAANETLLEKYERYEYLSDLAE